MWTPKKYLKWSFLLLPTCIKRTLVIKFRHPLDTGNAKDCLELPPTNFFIFTLKKVTDELIWLVSQYRIVFISYCLYSACLTHLISSNLSCNPCLWYYDQLVHFDKEINASVYRHSLWEYYKRFHCSFEWHLTPHMTLYIETFIRRTPCIKRTLQHSPEGVRLIQVSLYLYWLRAVKGHRISSTTVYILFNI